MGLLLTMAFSPMRTLGFSIDCATRSRETMKKNMANAALKSESGMPKPANKW